MTFKQKLNKITFIIIFCAIIFCSCTNENDRVFIMYNSIPAQEWFDKYVKHSTIVDKNGHTLIIHEIGSRTQQNYSFSIEHSPICEKCFKKYN